MREVKIPCKLKSLNKVVYEELLKQHWFISTVPNWVVPGLPGVHSLFTGGLQLDWRIMYKQNAKWNGRSWTNHASFEKSKNAKIWE